MNEDIYNTTYLPLIKSIAKDYITYGIPFEDLVQEGIIGVIKAEKHFDNDKGVKFTTYATYWIKKMMLSALETETKQREVKEKMEELSELPSTITTPEPDSQQEKRIRDDLTGNLQNFLPEQEATVIKQSIYQKKTLKQISHTLGISREKTRQIKKKALRRLKNHTKIYHKLTQC